MLNDADTQKTLWPAVAAAWGSFFNGTGGFGVPAVAFTGFAPGALPLPASVAASCIGVGKQARRQLRSGQGIMYRTTDSEGRTHRQLHASAQTGSNLAQVFAKTAAIFAAAYPGQLFPRGGRDPAPPLLAAAATQCEVWLSDSEANHTEALTVLGELFGGPMPPLTVSTAPLAGADQVSLQCFGSVTAFDGDGERTATAYQ